MKTLSTLIGVVALLGSSAALAGPCCENLGFAQGNSYVSPGSIVPTALPATTATAPNGNKASGGNVAGSVLSIATADTAVFGDVTVTAKTGGVASLADQVLSSNHAGLGVTTLVNGVASTTSQAIDGTDVLTITFDTPVQLTAIQFNDKNDSQVCVLGFCSYAPGSDLLTSATKFDLSVNGGAVQKYALGGYAPGTIDDNLLWLTTDNVVGTSFSFSVDTASGSTPFFIGGIAFCNAVPEPESYAMGLAGLGLLGLAARAKRSS